MKYYAFMTTHNNFDLNFHPFEVHFDLNESPNLEQQEEDDGIIEEEDNPPTHPRKCQKFNQHCFSLDHILPLSECMFPVCLK